MAPPPILFVRRREIIAWQSAKASTCAPTSNPSCCVAKKRSRCISLLPPILLRPIASTPFARNRRHVRHGSELQSFCVRSRVPMPMPGGPSLFVAPNSNPSAECMGCSAPTSNPFAIGREPFDGPQMTVRAIRSELQSFCDPSRVGQPGPSIFRFSCSELQSFCVRSRAPTKEQHAGGC